MTEHELWCNSLRFSAGRAYEVQRHPVIMTRSVADAKEAKACPDPLTAAQCRALVVRFGLTEQQASALCAMIWGTA